jgi:pimeloyl-ACP methyl ester carboxylesterase
VVLVDQRGTGTLSTLRCQEPKEELEDLPEAAQLAAIDTCLEQLKGDPRHYTTLDAVHDLDAAREALGYSQVHLLGVSYGTRVALAYLREYPKRVKTAVLDGVVPMTMVVGEQMALTAQRALDLDLQRCASTPACAARFPDLPAAMERVLDRLQHTPEHVKLRHPTTGAPVEVTLTRSASRRPPSLQLHAGAGGLFPSHPRRGRHLDYSPSPPSPFPHEKMATPSPARSTSGDLRRGRAFFQGAAGPGLAPKRSPWATQPPPTARCARTRTPPSTPRSRSR